MSTVLITLYFLYLIRETRLSLWKRKYKRIFFPEAFDTTTYIYGVFLSITVGDDVVVVFSSSSNVIVVKLVAIVKF